MQKPAVSFFPDSLLSVDTEMVDQGMMLHSRSPEEIVEYIASASTKDIIPDRSRSKEVCDSVVEIVDSLLK